MVLVKMDIHKQKNEVRPLYDTIHKNNMDNFLWIKHLNVRPESVSVLEENTGESSLSLVLRMFS